MRGTDFEQFLVQIFEALGFTVETTRTTCDHGVDLILTRSKIRIAVQAKGYEGNIGNHAVMEVVAGMNHYSCDMCMVVTNTNFTPAARDLAKSNSCTLISGDQIRDLIQGKIL